MALDLAYFRGEVRWFTAFAITYLSLSLNAQAAKLAEVEWTSHARRFTGESEKVRESSVDALRKDPHLAEKLKRAFGKADHFLALDVISVLGLHEFLPVLSKYSEKDKTGYSYHVLNSIAQPADLDQLGKLYVTRLEEGKVSSAGQMAILDSLGRMRIELPYIVLASSLHHADPEVRSAALYYLRATVVQWKRLDYVGLLATAIRDVAYQNRIQTLFLISEIPKTAPEFARGQAVQALLHCQNDPVASVKTMCNQLRDRFPSGAK